eukprot:gene286-1183_t
MIRAFSLLTSPAFANTEDTAAASNVLVTGFRKFNEFAANPSGEVAQRLKDNQVCVAAFNATAVTSAPKQICLHGEVLDVDLAGVNKGSDLAVDKKYDAIIHLGMEDDSKGFRVELAATNQFHDDNLSDYDNSNMIPFEIVPNAPILLPTTLPLDSYNGHSDKSSWSRDAGTFYCNRLYYQTLHKVRKANKISEHTGNLVPVVFVHLPPVHRNGKIKIEDIDGKQKEVEFNLNTITKFIVQFAADVVNAAHHSGAPVTADFTKFSKLAKAETLGADRSAFRYTNPFHSPLDNGPKVGEGCHCDCEISLQFEKRDHNPIKNAECDHCVPMKSSEHFYCFSCENGRYESCVCKCDEVRE